ncbi:MAG: 30S ribosomal protein S20 [Brevinemataceae bacterium]
MPNVKSAKIRMKQTEKRRIRNKSIKTFVRHLKRNTMNSFLEENMQKSSAELLLNEFKKQIDKAWAKGVLPRNTSSRIKSSIELLFNKQFQ